MRGSLQPLLGERVADALDHAALDLARGAERVDHAADVVDRGDAVDRDLAGLDVDRDLGDVDAERQHLHPGRVRAARAGAEDLPVAEQAEHLADRPALAARVDDHAARDVEVRGVAVVALRGELEQLPLRVGRSRARRRAHRRRRRRAARERGVRARGQSRRRRWSRARAAGRAPRPRSARAPSSCRCRRPAAR